ncbi:beta-lactamase family protein [Brevundimonas albigilva]|uniref:Beta-lactamase family protein n=1 Tax=Brevundimonas albigilva TaxID=1312364 RepID=A0ABY4SKH4_9CAUL|nr:serine hydrolase domain-containing protein [Brevundimonas albigilva]UQV17401.1 beta-lactamase family protein [Brevundimonas albigilva]URI14743.1 beta-lactamase family protein [Brevundimonas albigilva]
MTAGGLPFASSPEALGFDSRRLADLDGYMSGMVEAGLVAGTSTLLMRHGQVAAFTTFGHARLGDDAPLARDALFRIYSMTKPVTGVAMMILFEQGLWRLDDPITDHLPEFAGQRVYAGLGDDGAMRTVEADRPPTMRELMSHTAGFGYGLFDIHPIERAYRQAGVMMAQGHQQLVDRAARIPLMFQPGTEWFYSIAADLQAVVVERLTGMTFGDFLRARIFAPLGMVDTGFQVPADQVHRLAEMYSDDGAGGLKVTTTAFDMPINDYTRPPRFEGGGGGLVSTAVDYARFCQMVLNRGALDGVRILRPETVDLMATNAVPEAVLDRFNPLRLLPFNPALTFGLDFAITEDPKRLGLSEGKGTLSWGGGGGTWFWIDPENDVVFVGLIQRMADPVSNEFRAKARTYTYAALTHPEK